MMAAANTARSMHRHYAGRPRVDYNCGVSDDLNPDDSGVEQEETFAPATLGATPSSVDAPPRPRTAPVVSNWPMWALGLVLFIDQVDQSIVRGMIPELQAEFDVGDFEIGLLTSAFIIVNGVITLPAGYLADRWHRTRTIGHTVVGWSGITALGAVAPNFLVLLGLRGALGFGQAITEPAAASLIADYYPLEKRGRAFSIQQVMLIAGIGIGVGVGGFAAERWGWQSGFLIAGAPGIFIAAIAYRLREPRRGEADRVHVGVDESVVDADVEDESASPLAAGFVAFLRDMWDGLKADLRTIAAIPTMRYSLIGVAALQFSVFAISVWLPSFYERHLGVSQKDAETWFTVLILVGGIPGILLGGRIADKYATRVRGARVAIPAYCILVGTTFFTFSYIPGISFAAAFALELVGIFAMVMAIPALRAGLTDALPANLRGAGFGAFNIVTVLLGAAMAPLLVSALSDLFNLRTAFLLVTPPVYVGSWFLLKARDHLDADAAKIFEAILKAMQEQQEREKPPSP